MGQRSPSPDTWHGMDLYKRLRVIRIRSVGDMSGLLLWCHRRARADTLVRYSTHSSLSFLLSVLFDLARVILWAVHRRIGQVKCKSKTERSSCGFRWPSPST
jgi:hypothetical protein